MTPFNLEQFKSGRKALTRDGNEATFIAHDPTREADYRIIFSIARNGSIFYRKEDGKTSDGCVSSACDLVSMAPVKRSGWVNVSFGELSRFYCGTIHETKEMAIISSGTCSGYVATVRIEWEEA